MHSFIFHEKKQHGTLEFPAEYYYVDSTNPRYHMPFHWHKEWELIRVVQGSITIHADEEKFTATAGDILLIRDSMMHGGSSIDCIYECFVFDLHGMFRHSDSVKKSLRPIYRMELLPDIFYAKADKPEIHTFVSMLMDAHHQKGSDCIELITFGCLSMIFAYIIQYKLYTTDSSVTKSQSNRIGQIKSVLEYIELHYSSAITLEELAKIAGMSPKYFCRIFKAITQQSPLEYVIFYRIEQAANYLSTSDLSITEIAMECGFNDCSYFIRTFKNLKQVTPYKYRTQNKQH